MSQTFTNNLIREEVEDESPANTKMQERFVKTWMTSFLETKNNVSKAKVWRDQDGEMFILGLLKEQRQEQAHKERVSQVEELEMWDDCLQNLNSRSLKSPWAVLVTRNYLSWIKIWRNIFVCPASRPVVYRSDPFRTKISLSPISKWQDHSFISPISSSPWTGSCPRRRPRTRSLSSVSRQTRL